MYGGVLILPGRDLHLGSSGVGRCSKPLPIRTSMSDFVRPVELSDLSPTLETPVWYREEQYEISGQYDHQATVAT